jgi:acyl carrier protein
MLHRIWCEELARPPEDIGIHDSLDALGGKSIHAAAIIARIQSETGVTIHSSVLAEHSSIAALAGFVDRNAGLRSGGRQSRQRYFRG